MNSQAMDAKQQVIVVEDGGWGAQQKQHQVDEPQDKDHGQLPDATDVQEDRAGQQTQQHVPDKVLGATAGEVLGEGRSQGAPRRDSPALPSPASPELPSTTSTLSLFRPPVTPTAHRDPWLLLSWRLW